MDPPGILKEPVAGPSRKRGRPPKQKNTESKSVKFEDVYTAPLAPASVPSEHTSDFSDTGETSSDERPVVKKNIGLKGYRAMSLPLRKAARYPTEPSSIVTRSRSRNTGEIAMALQPSEANVEPDPTSYNEAMRSVHKDKWLEAINNELSSFEKTGTWEIVDAPDRQKAIRNRWVLTIKRNPDGSILKYKARLVAKGF